MHTIKHVTNHSVLVHQRVERGHDGNLFSSTVHQVEPPGKPQSLNAYNHWHMFGQPVWKHPDGDTNREQRSC